MATRVSSLSLVRYRRNDYSVPTSFGHREVIVRGYVHEVVIACGTEIIARHPRSYEREDFVFDPLHYLALIEQKINALDQAAPLAGWQLPEEFATLRRLLEARMGKPGKREFVQVLRLMEAFRIEDVTAAVRDAHCARRDRLRCHQASGAVPDRAPAAAPRHDGLSLPAKGHGRDDIGARLHGSAGGSGIMSDTPQVLLAHHLKALKLPTFLREYDKVARQCAAEGVDYPRYPAAARRAGDDRARAAHGRAPHQGGEVPDREEPRQLRLRGAAGSLNKALVMELARSEYVERRENIIAVGNSGTGKSHIGLGLGLAACQKGLSVGFTTAAAIVHELIEARDEKRLLRLQRQLAAYKLLIIDELGYRAAVADRRRAAVRGVLPAIRARLARIVTSNLPFDEWTSVFGSERLTGALLDRLTHHVHILEMNGDSYRLAHSKRRAQRSKSDIPPDDVSQK